MAVNNIGRPSKYSQEQISQFAKDLREWCKHPEHWWFKDFCLDNDLDPDYMSEWAATNEEFNGALREATHRQESKVLGGSMKGLYNSTMAKMVLTNRHNWAEKTETKLSGDSQNPLHGIIALIDGKTKDLVDDVQDNE